MKAALRPEASKALTATVQKGTLLNVKQVVDRAQNQAIFPTMIAEPQNASSSKPGAGQAVLVSGASFAGLATAFWMLRLGYRVTLVENALGLRRGGTPVDLGDATIGIIERMGLIGAVRAKALPPRAMEFKNADDTTVGKILTQPGDDPEQYEIHRDDLLDILVAALDGQCELQFGCSIASLTQDQHKVAVTFKDGSAADYAFVFGCDGNRSNTRRIAFGAETDFSYYMGGYFFLKVVPDTSFLPANLSQVCSQPGRTAMLNGYTDRTDLGLAFRSAEEIDYSHRDRAQQRHMIREHCAAIGWKVPAMLAYLDEDDDFYFDKINQIRMPAWSTGRIVLVGDAGYCVSPLAGMGGSMALIGASRLADALARHGDDHAAAFRKYDASLRPFVEEVQERAATTGLATIFPASKEELADRDRRISDGNLGL